MANNYYDVGGIKTREVIEAKVTASGFSGTKAFDYGNLLKYILRAPFKGSWESDLIKAKDYIDQLLNESPRN